MFTKGCILLKKLAPALVVEANSLLTQEATIAENTARPKCNFKKRNVNAGSAQKIELNNAV